MDPVPVFEQAKSNTMHWCISPPLVKEAASSIQVIEVVLIRLAPPEVHVPDLKIAPEVTRRVSIRLVPVVWPPGLVHHPVEGAVLVHELRVVGEEFLGLGPQGGDRLWRVVEVDGETVCLVVVLHVAEDVVVDIAEEVHFGLNAPVVLRVGQSGMLVEETAVPAAHLVVGDLVCVLNVVLLEDLHGFLEKIHVDPRGHLPMFFRYHLWPQKLYQQTGQTPASNGNGNVGFLLPYLVSAFVTSDVFFLNSSVNGTSLKNVHG